MKQYDLKLDWDDCSYYRRALRESGVEWKEGKGIFSRTFTFFTDEETYQKVEQLVVDDKMFMLSW